MISDNLTMISENSGRGISTMFYALLAISSFWSYPIVGRAQDNYELSLITSPTYSPNSHYVAFVVDGPKEKLGFTRSLWLVVPSTGQCRKLPLPGSVDVFGASWSPDGDKLVCGLREKDALNTSLWEIDISDLRSQRLYSRRGVLVERSRWDCTGHKVFFLLLDVTRRLPFNVAWFSFVSKSLSLVTQRGDVATMGWQVSPDSKRIYFATQHPAYLTGAREPAIWVINLNGTHERKILDLDGQPMGLAVSLDEQRLAYVVDVWQNEERPSFELRILDTRTRESQKLGLLHAPHLYSFAWMPDGENLVFSKTNHIMVYNCTSESVKTLLSLETEVVSLSCSPDGKSVALVSGRLGYSSLKGYTTPRIFSPKLTVLDIEHKATKEVFSESIMRKYLNK